MEYIIPSLPVTSPYTYERGAEHTVTYNYYLVTYNYYLFAMKQLLQRTRIL